MNMITSVIWDWNGTLLNDVDVSVKTVNGFLASKGLKQLSIDYYRDHFTFPVKNFYEKIGIKFDRQDFDNMSREFIQYYFENLKNAQLHERVIETLQLLQDAGVRQFVLSAMEQSRLENSLKDYNIYRFFHAVQGLNDLYANGKAEAGKKLIRDHAIDPASSWMVGDTLHDLEVANTLNLHCILFSGGHYSLKRLQNKNAPVVKDFKELKNFFARHLQ